VQSGIKRHRGFAAAGMSAVRQQHIGCALGEEHVRVAFGMVHHQHRHHFALGGEGGLADALEAFFALGRGCAAQLVFGHQKDGIGRVAPDNLCTGVVLLKLGITGQTAASQHSLQFLVQGAFRQCGSGLLGTALRGRNPHR
jgi:hypothetical protein